MTPEGSGAPQVLSGRYALTPTQRAGAQAVVTQAFDLQTSRMVAVKRVRFGPNDQRARESFQREASMLQDLRHPHIVELIDVDRDPDGNWYLVLEWVQENLEDLITREGPMSWADFWERLGHPLLQAIVFAQKKRVAHRDIKPKNILITEAGVPKLADYGIAKLLERADAWALSSGHTFRFDHTRGYTPPEPDEPQHSFSRDAYAFAAVAATCLTGRIFDRQEDLFAAMQEAVMPPAIRKVLTRCLAADAAERPQLASIVAAEIERVQEEANRSQQGVVNCHLSLTYPVIAKIETFLDVDNRAPVEQFILEELTEASAVLPPDEALVDEVTSVDLIAVTWRFRARLSGRHKDVLEIYQVSEIGASLAAEMRDRCLARQLRFTFARPRDAEADGQRLRLLLAEAADFQRERAEARAARSSQRIFRVWRSYLRDRADLESKRTNALRYVDRRASNDQVVFVTEIAHNESLMGQERVVQHAAGRLAGRISAVAFNQITLDVTFGDAAKLPRRGELAINTIAAQRALEHQTNALNAVLYERQVANPALKTIILQPSSATPVQPVSGIEPTDPDFDAEKRQILSKALGVQDVLAIEGPPGTGKTKLITEIVVQWLKRNPQHRILLSSQTHIALDNVLERVAELSASLDMIRIGRPEEPRISDFSKTLLLERRVETWIAEVRRNAEADMQRWADENGVDRHAVAVGMKVERLLQVIACRNEMRAQITSQETERAALAQEADQPTAHAADSSEVDEETTQIESEIGALRLALAGLDAEARKLRESLQEMGAYAAELSRSEDPQELSEWAHHFLADEPTVAACRARLALLEDWQLRVGRSPDFNAAMLSSAQIIAGTCVGIAGVKGMEQVNYDLCIIDEASKATATEILIPMSRSRRWIIVGDPKQLPPFFEEFGEDILDQFDDAEVRATLLDRFLDENEGLPQGCRAGLKNQYRMIEPIGDLVSECFYDGDLKSPIKTHGLKLAAAFPKPVTWYSTHKLPKHHETPEGQTFCNPVETEAIRGLLQRLNFVAKAQKRRLSVAVIAGYTAQVALLAEIISQGVGSWPDLDVTCNSVDAIQGRQADICIYSVVRSNSHGSLGFLREKPRLNVALSRGKSALVIVGDQFFCRRIRGPNPFRRVIKFFDDHEDTCTIETLE